MSNFKRVIFDFFFNLKVKNELFSKTIRLKGKNYLSSACVWEKK